MKQMICSRKGLELLDLPAALHRQGLDDHVAEFLVVVDRPLVLVGDGQREGARPGGLHLHERALLAFAFSRLSSA